MELRIIFRAIMLKAFFLKRKGNVLLKQHLTDEYLMITLNLKSNTSTQKYLVFFL